MYCLALICSFQDFSPSESTSVRSSNFQSFLPSPEFHNLVGKKWWLTIFIVRLLSLVRANIRLHYIKSLLIAAHLGKSFRRLKSLDSNSSLRQDLALVSIREYLSGFLVLTTTVPITETVIKLCVSLSYGTYILSDVLTVLKSSNT